MKSKYEIPDESSLVRYYNNTGKKNKKLAIFCEHSYSKKIPIIIDRIYVRFYFEEYERRTHKWILLNEYHVWNREQKITTIFK